MCVIAIGAQCSPRQACPLKGGLLMQMHDRPRGVPVLALAGGYGGQRIQQRAQSENVRAGVAHDAERVRPEL